MKLNFVKPHLSIKRKFEEIDLPDFTLITGRNGSGKSHFLEAVLNGGIITDVVPTLDHITRNQIRLFRSNDFSPGSSSSGVTFEYLREKRVELVKKIQAALERNQEIKEHYKNFVINYRLPPKYFANYSDLLNLSRVDFFDLIRKNRPELEQPIVKNYSPPKGLPQPQMINQLESAYTSLQNMFDAALKKQPGGLEVEIIDGIRRATNKSPAAVSEADLANLNNNAYDGVDLFTSSFANLFTNYRNQKWQNIYARFLTENGLADIEYYSNDEEFQGEFGPPPWDEVNDILSLSKLDFVINKPFDSLDVAYTPTLTKISTGDEVQFNALSSGEKVIMSFVLSIFYSSDGRQFVRYPKILLLDEFDAHLHPSMCADMLNIIREVIINKYKTKVIAATHSPTTVALAEEGELFQIDSGRGGLRPIEKDVALNLLTYGLPTISISYKKRAQVFVESKNDASLLTSIYSYLKGDLDSPKSLEFIAVGHSINGGCDRVRDLVGELFSKGNESVFGLIDWDGKNLSTERIVVLAEGERDGIESLILDPLALTFSVFRDHPAEAQALKFSTASSHRELENAGLVEWQDVASKFVAYILGSPASELITHEYCGGYTLEFDVRWSMMDDHELEELILAKLSFMRLMLRGSNNIKERVTSTIFRDTPEFIPVQLREALRTILNLL